MGFSNGDKAEWEDIRQSILEQLLSKDTKSDGELDNCALTDPKEQIRLRHHHQRVARNTRELAAIGRSVPKLIDFFANGDEVNPYRIDPVLEVVESETEQAELFRLATLLWSIPVSKGFGRRMRYLVKDAYNDKLIGIFALGDPVFNLRTRDNWIGWTVAQRTERLAHVMDAYIVGAMPPYSMLLGGKLVAGLMGSEQVRQNFELKYTGRRGIISEQQKAAHLGLITVTSALGRSSIYNRLRLPNLVDLHRIGYTEGWGHFQISEEVFNQLRGLLKSIDHPYADGHAYGDGPNWRIRTIRHGLTVLGLDPNILRHGIRREVFAMALCRDVGGFLRGERPYQPVTVAVSAIAEAAKERWIVPRATRKPEYRTWTRDQTREQLLGSACNQLPLLLSH